MKYILLIFLLTISCNKTESKPLFKFSGPSGDNFANINGTKITKNDFNKNAKYRIEVFNKEKELFDYKLSEIKRKAVESIIKKDPASKGMKQEDYLKKNVFSKLTITDATIDAFIAENKIPKERIDARLKAQVKGYLANQEQAKMLDGWIASKIGGKQIEVFLQKPQRPKFTLPSLAGAPSHGSNNAKVTIVEFSDFQCPACAGAVPILKKIKKAYPKDVKVVYKNYPLSFHKQAKTAGIAAMCLFEQKKDKFWEFHSELFANQRKLSVPDLKGYGKKYGVDQAKYEKCIDDRKFEKYVEQDINDGKNIGVFSTPTFFVNGKIVTGALPFEQFKEIIDEELTL